MNGDFKKTAQTAKNVGSAENSKDSKSLNLQKDFADSADLAKNSAQISRKNSPNFNENSVQKIAKKSKKSFEKRAKNARKTFDKISAKILKHAHKFVLDRFDNLRKVRREVAVWALLVAVLISAGVAQSLLLARNIQTSAAVSGGTYAEGVVDKITTLNPLFAATDAEKAASTLVFSSLLKYDNSNHLAGNLAEKWSVSADGKTWNVILRENVKWSDGENLTADDVIFTINLMKNPALNSPLYASWREISASKISAREVKFDLPTAYTAFPFALTFGVLPSHILEKTEIPKIREFFSANFLAGANFANSTQNVSGGAFKFSQTETLANGQILWNFARNENYFADKPRVENLTIRVYNDEKTLTNGVKNGEITAAAEISMNSAAENFGENAEKSAQNLKLTAATLTDGVFVLFNNSAPILSDKNVRESLRFATDRENLRKIAVKNGLKIPEKLETPIARGVYSSIDNLAQPSFNIDEAAKKLDESGWKLNDKNLREKNGEILSLNILTIKGADYEIVAQKLAEQWKKIGVETKITAADASLARQNYLAPRNYDVLIYQLHLGADADQFAYWASSETGADGLNFANYASTRADLALAAGRTQPNAAARETRYNEFVKQWLADAPAIALYQPNYYYLSENSAKNLSGAALIDGANHLRNAANFTVKTEIVNKTQ